MQISSIRQAFQSVPTAAQRTRTNLLADNAQHSAWDHDLFGKAQLRNIYLRARQGAEVKAMVDTVGDTFGQRGFKLQTFPNLTLMAATGERKHHAQMAAFYQQSKLGKFGPENHVPPELLKSYDERISRWNWAREHLPQLRPVPRLARKEQ